MVLYLIESTVFCTFLEEQTKVEFSLKKTVKVWLEKCWTALFTTSGIFFKKNRQSLA
jgi:hypothetical protein